MTRAILPLLILILLLGIPAIVTGAAYTGQVLFAMLMVLFLGTLVEAFVNRAHDEN